MFVLRVDINRVKILKFESHVHICSMTIAFIRLTKYDILCQLNERSSVLSQQLIASQQISNSCLCKSEIFDNILRSLAFFN